MRKQIKNIETRNNAFANFQSAIINQQQLSVIKGGNGGDTTGIIGTEDVVDGIIGTEDVVDG